MGVGLSRGVPAGSGCALYGPGPSRVKGAAHRLRDGLRPPLTREPLPALGQALSGRPWPARWVRAARARSSGLTGCGYPRRIVGGAGRLVCRRRLFRCSCDVSCRRVRLAEGPSPTAAGGWLLSRFPAGCLAAAASAADLVGDGEVPRDDPFRLFRGDRCAVDIADDVRHLPVHHGPGPFSERAGDHAQRLEVLGAAFDHLRVVDPGQLRVLPAGVVGGPDQGGPQQGGTGLAHWCTILALTVPDGSPMHLWSPPGHRHSCSTLEVHDEFCEARWPRTPRLATGLCARERRSVSDRLRCPGTNGCFPTGATARTRQ